MARQERVEVEGWQRQPSVTLLQSLYEHLLCFKGPATYSSSRLFLQVLFLLLKLIHRKQIEHRALNYLNVNYLLCGFQKRNIDQLLLLSLHITEHLTPRIMTMNLPNGSQLYSKTKQMIFQCSVFNHPSSCYS